MNNSHTTNIIIEEALSQAFELTNFSMFNNDDSYSVKLELRGYSTDDEQRYVVKRFIREALVRLHDIHHKDYAAKGLSALEEQRHRDNYIFHVADILNYLKDTEKHFATSHLYPEDAVMRVEPFILLSRGCLIPGPCVTMKLMSGEKVAWAQTWLGSVAMPRPVRMML